MFVPVYALYAAIAALVLVLVAGVPVSLVAALVLVVGLGWFAVKVYQAVRYCLSLAWFLLTMPFRLLRWVGTRRLWRANDGTLVCSW